VIRETLRWSAVVRNRGQDGLLNRSEPRTPRTIPAVSRIRETTPVARVKYQSGLGVAVAARIIRSHPTR
jgi:hypothetical protein